MAEKEAQALGREQQDKERKEQLELEEALKKKSKTDKSSDVRTRLHGVYPPLPPSLASGRQEGRPGKETRIYLRSYLFYFKSLTTPSSHGLS